MEVQYRVYLKPINGIPTSTGVLLKTILKPIRVPNHLLNNNRSIYYQHLVVDPFDCPKLAELLDITPDIILN